MDKTTPEPGIPDFNRTQLHIMQILWAADDALKPADIESRFEWPIENATLRSVLALMLERGDLEREKRGKAFHYFPSKGKSSAISDIFSGLAKVFGSGSRVGLLAQLIEDESLDPDEVRQLQEIANSLPDKADTNQKPNQKND